MNQDKNIPAQPIAIATQLQVDATQLIMSSIIVDEARACLDFIVEMYISHLYCKVNNGEELKMEEVRLYDSLHYFLKCAVAFAETHNPTKERDAA